LAIPHCSLAKLVSKYTRSQRLAAALNHSTLGLHESLLPNRQAETVGRGMRKSEGTYLFRVSLSCVKHFARAWSLPLSTEGKDDRRIEMTKVVLLHRTNLPCSVKTYPWCIWI
jgi:hypothetical protein